MRPRYPKPGVRKLLKIPDVDRHSKKNEGIDNKSGAKDPKPEQQHGEDQWTRIQHPQRTEHQARSNPRTRHREKGPRETEASLRVPRCSEARPREKGGVWQERGVVLGVHASD